MKIAELTSKPEDDDTPWVPYSKIADEDHVEPRFTVIFGTNKTLERLNKSCQFHIDATYKVNWQGYPMFVCGVTGSTGKFFGTMTVLSSHEDTEAWSEVYLFVHSYGAHFDVFMGDGAKAITKAKIEVFSESSDCSCAGGKRLMCWPHVYRNIQPKIRGMIGSVNKEKAKSLLEDIENLQWSCTSEETFSTAYNLVQTIKALKGRTKPSRRASLLDRGCRLELLLKQILIL